MAASAPPPTSPVPPELPVTADRPAIQPIRKRRPFGVRLWLGLMFSAIGILDRRATRVVARAPPRSPVGPRRCGLADEIGQPPPARRRPTRDVLGEIRRARTSRPGSSTTRARWPAEARRRGASPARIAPCRAAAPTASRAALDGDRYVDELPGGDRTMVGGAARPRRRDRTARCCCRSPSARGGPARRSQALARAAPDAPLIVSVLVAV